MENLQITKKLKAFWMRAAYACIIGVGILSMNGCSKTTDEQITPQTQTNSFVKEYNLKEVAKPTDGKKIIYLKDLAKASAFFQNLKMKKVNLPNLTKKSSSARTNNAAVLSHGFFTFLNGQTATIHFNTHPDGIGEIERASVDGQDLEITYRSRGYIEMIKWGCVAVHYGENGLSENYFYYLAPIAIYRAALVNGGWSSVQLLNTYEQANFEGDGGTWEEVYIANPHLPGYDLPVIDPWFPQTVQGY